MIKDAKEARLLTDESAGLRQKVIDDILEKIEKAARLGNSSISDAMPDLMLTEPTYVIRPILDYKQKQRLAFVSEALKALGFQVAYTHGAAYIPRSIEGDAREVEYYSWNFVISW